MEANPTTSSPVSREPQSSTNSTHEANNPRRSYPAIVHFAVVAAVILPLAFVPYISTRRQLSALHGHTRHLEVGNALLRKDLSSFSSELGRVKDDVRRMRGLLHEVMEEIEDLRTNVRQGEAARTTIDAATRSELQRLLEVARVSRLHGETLRDMGLSLAEIAAFMHENELRMPLIGKRGDSSRVDKVRSAALKLQKLPCGPKFVTKKEETESGEI